MLQPQNVKNKKFIPINICSIFVQSLKMIWSNLNLSLTLNKADLVPLSDSTISGS